MKLGFKKVGKIGEAIIETKGLTVIAGENDTGKSTIGKAFFALIKAINTTQEYYIQDKQEKSLRMIWDIYSVLNAKLKKITTPTTAALFNPNHFTKELISCLQFNLPADDIVAKRKELLPELNLTDVELKRVEGLLTGIINLFAKKLTKENIINDAIRKAIQGEFRSQVNNSVTGETSELYLEYNEGNKNSFVFENNKLIDINSYSDTEHSIKEATLIESPAFLQAVDTLKGLPIFSDMGIGATDIKFWNGSPITFHLKDFSIKIDSYKYRKGKESAYSSRIKDIIKGEFYFDPKKEEMFFRKNSSDSQSTASIRTINTAIGVRSFGILDILLKVGAIGPSEMLIVDEPETHLHPVWQLEYARLIVDLVCDGVPVIITSHSPYMIEALRHYSKKKGIFDSATKFYLVKQADDSGNFCNVVDLKNNLDPIFQKLSDPLKKILYED
ncbi:MAG: AAA family ATPase [Elusimicrobiota bacterium]|jgi:predicted ATPase|nr:AAA family ATPase [Elusimicrobiota bacterium]